MNEKCRDSNRSKLHSSFWLIACVCVFSAIRTTIVYVCVLAPMYARARACVRWLMMVLNAVSSLCVHFICLCQEKAQANRQVRWCILDGREPSIQQVYVWACVMVGSRSQRQYADAFSGCKCCLYICTCHSMNWGMMISWSEPFINIAHSFFHWLNVYIRGTWQRQVPLKLDTNCYVCRCHSIQFG